MMHLRFFNAARKAGFSANVSTRALIIRLPMPGSFAQDGISPQSISFMYRLPSSPTTITACVGAILNRGLYVADAGGNGAPKRSATFFKSVARVYRPHMAQRSLVVARGYFFTPKS